MVDTNKQDLGLPETGTSKIKVEWYGLGEENFSDYKWLNSVFQNKISPVLLGKLDDAMQTDKFETSQEYEDFLTQSLDKLMCWRMIKKTM